MLAAGVRLDLVGDELMAAALRAGYSLDPFGDGSDARFSCDTDIELAVAIRQRGGHYELATISRDTTRIRDRSPDLAVVQRQAIAHLTRDVRGAGAVPAPAPPYRPLSAS